MESLIFYIAAFLTVFFIVLMIFQKNPVASAIFLVGSFFSLAVIYILLQAHFVAVLQILVYAGAIMVLFIFVIMLLNLRQDELVADAMSIRNVILIFLGLGLFAFFAYFFMQIPHSESTKFTEVGPDFGNALGIAKLMFKEYVVAFEIMGLLLLVGLIGAVTLGRKDS